VFLLIKQICIVHLHDLTMTLAINKAIMFVLMYFGLLWTLPLLIRHSLFRCVYKCLIREHLVVDLSCCICYFKRGVLVFNR